MSGGLQWFIDLNTAGLERGAAKAKHVLNDLGREKLGEIGLPGNIFGKMLGPAGLATAATAAMGLAIKESISTASELGEQFEIIHEKTGLSVGSAYMLRDAYRAGGLGAEEMSSSFSKMEKSLAESLVSGKNGGMLAHLGLDAKSISEMSPEEQFQKIGNAINGLQNPLEKTRAAMEIFGKTGANLIPVFASESFKAGGEGMSNTARLLTEHAAEFKEQHDLNAHVWKDAQEQVAVGFNSIVAGPNTMLAKLAKRGDFSEIARLETSAMTGGAVGLTKTALGDFWDNRAYKKDPKKWMSEHGGKAPAAFDAENLGEGRFHVWGDNLARVGGGGHYANLSNTRDKQEITNSLLRDIRDAVKHNKGTAAPDFKGQNNRQMARMA